MIYHFSEHSSITFEAMPPLLLPFYNLWGRNAYWHYNPFSFDPFTIRAESTSGSPVVLAGGKFFGFLNESGGTFAFDGIHTLTVTGEAGQELYYDESCDPYRAWLDYNAIVRKDFETVPEQPFWGGLEYCTWVEQKRQAVLSGLRSDDPLCESLVYDYMKRIDRLGLPRGKLTIDDGWAVRHLPDGTMTYGDWEIDRVKFPDLSRLVRDIESEGFLPGLWFAPFTFTPNSRFAQQNPHLIGHTFTQNAEEESSRRLMYILPDPILEDYYRRLFTPYIQMGFRKFKMDMSYGAKTDMKQQLAMIYRVIKEADPTIEVEAHVPDIFLSRYCDTVRINDVAFDGPGDWRAVTLEHYKICRYSSSHKLLNLDHIGTNTPIPQGKLFLEHLKLLLSLEGYPTVSLLPDFFGKAICDESVARICEWANAHPGK